MNVTKSAGLGRFLLYAVGVPLGILCIAGGWWVYQFVSATSDEWIDETQNAKLWGGYTLAGDYRLKVPVFVVDSGKDIGLALPTSGTSRGTESASVPDTIEQYRANPTRWPRITGVLEAGATIHITRFALLHRFEYNTIYVYGDVAGDGRLKDICVNSLSQRTASDVSLWEPDPKWMEGVAK